MIEAVALRKTFPTTEGGEKVAVDDVSFVVQAGETFGLLGPNGAGKTTTLRMLAGLITPTEGHARIDGCDAITDRRAVQQRLGYLTASTGLYQRFTPREMLTYFGKLYGLNTAAIRQRSDELIGWLGMSDFADLRCGGLSTGQKQRANIARALVADPPVLILDEPTLGLDVLTNRVILDFILAERNRGKTIILSTHYLDEAESLCDRFGLLHDGQLIADSTLAELQQRSGETRLTDIFLTLCGQSRHVLEGAAAGAATATEAAT